MIRGGAVLGAALLWGMASPIQAADGGIVVQAPSPDPVQGREGAKIRVLGGGGIDTGALGLVFSHPVSGVSPGVAEVTVPVDKLQPALVELASGAMKGCETLDLDVRPAMRRIEQGPWAPFVDLRVSEETGPTEKLLSGESGINVVSDAPDRRSNSIQLSMSAYIQTRDGARTRVASCGILMIATDKSFPVDWIEALFAKRRLGAPNVFTGGETWTLGPPTGVDWPAERRAQLGILRSPSGTFSVRYSLYQPL